jgi:hypothetical protein
LPSDKWCGCSSGYADPTAINSCFIPGNWYRIFVNNGYRIVIVPSPGLDLDNYRKNNVSIKLIKLSGIFCLKLRQLVGVKLRQLVGVKLRQLFGVKNIKISRFF